MTNVRQQWKMWSGELDEGIINAIINEAGPTNFAETFNNQSNVRSSQVSWLTKVPWILDILYQYVDFANQSAFNVNIYKKADIQYTEYHAEQKGHYGLHHDIDWNRNDGLDRKLSVTVQLSDPSEYEGGLFEFTEVESPKKETCKAKGTILVFPSYLAHKVNPVTQGTRKSLVAWFEGPKWC